MKKKFIYDWSKTYTMSGRVVVEAESQEEAFNILDTMVGDLSGSMQYLPEENTYDIIGVE